ncbi:MAG: site-specific integrase [Alphaproteobacteria bacterium]|nr:MAG: site-specific integrase [Alphaproteobacteria bacterium]
MPGRQAKLITERISRRALGALDSRQSNKRDRVIFLLSLRAGLRACEISGLDWSMVTDATGRVGRQLAIHDRIAKKEGGRRIPLHPQLRAALAELGRGRRRTGAIVQSQRSERMTPNSIVNWFVELYAEIGATGCSSHSGRRTFITHAARQAHKAGASLRDVQLLAGHRSIEVTQGYIDGDSDAQRRLVSLL